ncbi:MAG: CRISPR-associated endonuclease Cas3'' [Clostridiales bacterium]|nr:CRISPR-associated endonuclease Cas3'' [Clostridiales bacterium]
MYAHRRKSDGKTQELGQHSRNVAHLSFLTSKSKGLGTLSKLIGLLHDLGKGKQEWQDYLFGFGRRHPTHAALGALYAWRRWGESEQDFRKRRTAQLISLCIAGHHTGLQDCLNKDGDSPFLMDLQNQTEADYQEATKNFYIEVASAEELDELFSIACQELDAFGLGNSSFSWGMLARLLLSVLVDADRWDSACFENDIDPFTVTREEPDWGDLLVKLEQYLAQFPKEGPLAETRWMVSEYCKDAGSAGPGIYTLSVPTGGGKTYSSLRFALAQAQKNKSQRIFYIIPMNTILDQNARDIRDALGDYPSILEHHSNVVLEDEKEEASHRRLTERWDSDIILTSLVQFLNALFQDGNNNVRRMHRLVHSVLIFDEIQALPKKCQGLFQKAVQFLVQYCQCTVLLCTATQPNLALKAAELVPDVNTLYKQLKRVEYLPQLQQRTYQDAADDIAAMVRENRSVLTIVNTKAIALRIYESVSQRLMSSGYRLTEVQQGLSDEELEVRAKTCNGDEVLCVHLSTLMCPMHRKEILRWVKAWLKEHRLVCCVSTALIEAGINVSFPVVVRSLAGIPSIIQAGGRCNRNFEWKLGQVYLWDLADENLKSLPDIQKGKLLSRSLLNNGANADSLGSPEIVEAYFRKEEAYTKEVELYPYPAWETNLVTMLSDNRNCANIGKNIPEFLSKRLRQSFRTAGKAFQVIDQRTKSVLVPYGKGAELIQMLESRHTMQEEIACLKEAQQYSVNLYEQMFDRLAREGALHALGETGVVVLQAEYYNADTGVSTTPRELELLLV